MEHWRTADPDRPAVLVTVAIVEGSAPREAGAKMLVTATGFIDTIGGGHLEMRALETARAMLADGRARHFERFALGPSLGQCCGGVVHLAFELADPAQLALLATRREHDCWRLVALDGDADSAVLDGAASMIAGAACPQFSRERGTHLMRDAHGRRWLADLVAAPRAHLMLFGAGHVGLAIVRALAHLPCRVTWVDEREDMFPQDVPANVTLEATDNPSELVAAAPANACFLVMTHSHALDQRLAEAILTRAEVGWFGLIGSKTKRRQFEHRLRARGVPEARIGAMVCPIGLPGIAGKAPAIIAASVAAQLLMEWEHAAQRAATPSLRLIAS